MSNSLSKIFVTVTSDKHDAFIAKYVSPAQGTERVTDYDAKVVFLDKTQEIFTKGKLYGLNNKSDVDALSTLIGTLPTRPAVGTEGEPGYEAERNYSSVIEYINEMATGQASVSTKLASSITVAGGPLANNIAESDDIWPWDLVDGNKVIPAGTSFEEIFTKLFLKVNNGTVTLGSITWNPQLAKPTATINKTGEQEVGTTATVTIAAVNTVSGNSRSVTVTATEGHFVGTSTIWVSGNYTQSVTGSKTGTAAISASTWNTADTVSNGDTVTIVEGTNTLSVTANNVTAAVDALTETTVWPSTNTKSKMTTGSVTVTDTKPSDKPLTRTNTATVTGVRYMFSGSSVSQDETIDSAIVRALSNSSKAKEYKDADYTKNYSVSVVEGAKQVIVAVPAKYKVTEVKDSGAFGTDIFSSFEELTVNVEGANGFTAAAYKVYAYKPLSALGENTYYVKVVTA